MAYWNKYSVPNKKSVIMTIGSGINTDKNSFEIAKEESPKSLNTSNRLYPSLATRSGTESMYSSAGTPIPNVNGATTRAGSTFHVVSGTTWKYWNGTGYTNVATGLTSAESTFVEFTTALKKYTLMANGTNKKAWDGTSAIDLTQAPATKLIYCNDNRMFALKDSSLYTSDIGDITNWTTGDSTIVGLFGMTGSGTALIIYNDMIISWSDRTMHIVYGKVKDDFDPTEPIHVGNVSNKATLIHGQNGILYWMDYNRFMAFSSGLPREVSKKARGYLEQINYTYKEKIVCGQWNRYIYISFPYQGSTVNNLTLEYDTERDMWFPYDKGFTDFINIGQDIYGVTAGGVVEKMNQGLDDSSSKIVWEHETGVIDVSPIKNLKHITDIWAVVDIPIGSTVTLSYSRSIDSSDFVELHTFTPDANEKNTRIRIPTTELQRLNWYRLKFSGVGACAIHYLELHGRTGN
jgi:hypothetical protein